MPLVWPERKQTMNSERLFIVHKVWQLVGLSAEQRRRCRWVNMYDFRNALDS
jgi:hypothetical protein